MGELALQLWTWVVGFIVALLLACVVNAARRPKRTPKGAWFQFMPRVGESFHLDNSPINFVLSRHARYGDCFSSNILGINTVCVSSADAVKRVLTSRDAFPQIRLAALAMATDEGLFNTHLHSPARSVVGSTLVPFIRDCVPFIDGLARSMLCSWAERKCVNTHKEVEKFTFSVDLHFVCKHLEVDSAEAKEMGRLATQNGKGFTAWPWNVPFSQIRTALVAKEKIFEKMESYMVQRRQEGKDYDDLLGALMEYKLEDESQFTPRQICLIIITVFFAGFETTSALIPWIMKFLDENPAIFEAVRAEHMSLRQTEDYVLTPLDMKNHMPLSNLVFLEGLRCASLVPFIPRTAAQDVELNGHFIPKGWKVWASVGALHRNPEYFPEPWKFDPFRFEVPPKPNTFFPFGHGPHKCPGGELSKTEVLVFLHYLVTQYRWERIGPNPGHQHWALTPPKGGYPIRISKRL